MACCQKKPSRLRVSKFELEREPHDGAHVFKVMNVLSQDLIMAQFFLQAALRVRSSFYNQPGSFSNRVRSNWVSWGWLDGYHFIKRINVQRPWATDLTLLVKVEIAGLVGI